MNTILRKASALAVGAACALGIMTESKPAAAQEIQLTGPLAGAPACRHCRLSRQGRVNLAIGPAFTLLVEYKRTIFIADRLEYTIFDFLGVDIFGGYGAANLNTDLPDKVDSTAPRNSRTATNLVAKNVQAYDVQTGKLKFMA